MHSYTFVVSIVFTGLALLTLFIISIVMINTNNNSGSGDEGSVEINEECVGQSNPCVPCEPCEPCVPCEPCQPCVPCIPPPPPATFTTIQSMSSENVEGGNITFGTTMANDGEWLSSGQDNQDGTSSVFLYQNVFADQPNVSPNYVLLKTFNVTGSEPIISMSKQAWVGCSRSFLSIGVTTPGTGGVKDGKLYEYIYSKSLWSTFGESILSAPPISISQYKSTAAVVYGNTVHLYSGGVINATFSNLGALDVSMDGNQSYSYLLIGCSGAAYMFSKPGPPEGGNWGTPVKTYQDVGAEFGNQVSIQLPYFTISDFRDQGLTTETVQSRLIVYSASNVDTPQAYIVLPCEQATEYESTIIGGSVFITSNGSVQMYGKSGSGLCPSDWYQLYLWNFPTTDRTVTSGHGNIININNTVGSSYSTIDIYQRIFPIC